MYPLAHLYFMEFSFKKLDDAAILGSIFPDLVILSGLSWKKSHSLGTEIRRHFQDSGEEKSRFSLGVVSHGIEPRGLDYYSDEKYEDFERGYCYEKARPLVGAVIEACGLSSNDGWWKAHNFIEMGIELYVNKQRPDLISQLQTAFSNLALIDSITRDLSPLLNIEESVLQDCFSKFRRFAVTEPVDARAMALRYQKQIYFRNNIEFIDINQSIGIIEQGERIILPDIELFFHDVRSKMASIWEE